MFAIELEKLCRLVYYCAPSQAEMQSQFADNGLYLTRGGYESRSCDAAP